jgi:hypothetical protein
VPRELFLTRWAPEAGGGPITIRDSGAAISIRHRALAAVLSAIAEGAFRAIWLLRQVAAREPPGLEAAISVRP